MYYFWQPHLPVGDGWDLSGRLPHQCCPGDSRLTGSKKHSQERLKLQSDQVLSLCLLTWAQNKWHHLGSVVSFFLTVMTGKDRATAAESSYLLFVSSNSHHFHDFKPRIYKHYSSKIDSFSHTGIQLSFNLIEYLLSAKSYINYK